MFHVELAPLGGILGPLKSDLGVFWAKIPLYPYNVKFSNSIFSKPPNLPILSSWILNLHIIMCQFQQRSTMIHFFLSVHAPATSEYWYRQRHHTLSKEMITSWLSLNLAVNCHAGTWSNKCLKISMKRMKNIDLATPPVWSPHQINNAIGGRRHTHECSWVWT